MINWLTVGYFAFLIETAAFAISVLVVPGLSMEEFGAYKLAGSIILVGSYATSCGLDATLQRFGAELVAGETISAVVQVAGRCAPGADRRAHQLLCRAATVPGTGGCRRSTSRTPCSECLSSFVVC